MNRFAPESPALGDNALFVMARGGRRTPHGVLATLVLLLVTLAAFIVAYVQELVFFGDDEQHVTLLHEIYSWTAPFVSMVVLLGIWVVLFEGRPFGTLGLAGDRPVRRFLRGSLVGFVMIAGVVGLMAISGNVRIEHDAVQAAGWSAASVVVLFLLVFIVQGAAEEILFRGWYLPVVGARHRPWLGIVASTGIFAAFHSATDPLATANLVLFGLFVAVYCLHEASVWGVCGWHATWNWGQASVFGLPVSGNAPPGTLFDLKATGSKIFSGGEYGPEGSIWATLVLLAGVAAVESLMLWRYRKAVAVRVSEGC